MQDSCSSSEEDINSKEDLNFFFNGLSKKAVLKFNLRLLLFALGISNLSESFI